MLTLIALLLFLQVGLMFVLVMGQVALVNQNAELIEELQTWLPFNDDDDEEGGTFTFTPRPTPPDLDALELAFRRSLN